MTEAGRPMWSVRSVDGKSSIDAQRMEQGLQLALDSRVSTMVWDPGMHMLRASVQDPSGASYNTMVKLAADPEDAKRWHLLVGVCSCPVGQNCAHAVALMEAGLREEKVVRALNKAFHPDTLEEETPDIFSSKRQQTWERTLAGLLPEQDSSHALGTPIALAFAVSEHARSVTEDESSQQPRAPRQVLVRPVSLGAKGAWIRSNITWENLNYLNYSRRFNERHLRWLIDFAAWAKRHSTTGFTRFESGWIDLGRYESAHLWTLLGEARDMGMPLVGTDDQLKVQLSAEQAVVSLDVRSDAQGLTVRPQISVGPKAFPADEFAVLGQPGHGLMRLKPQGHSTVLELFKLDAPLNAQRAQFLQDTPKLHVPQREATSFLGTYVPRLAQELTVFSSDQSVKIEEVQPPVLSMLVQFQAQHVTTIHSEWHYPNSQSHTVQALYPSADEDTRWRDIRHEREVLSRILPVVASVSELSETSSAGMDQLSATAHLRDFSTVSFVEEVLPELRRANGVELVVEGEPADYRQASNQPTFELAVRDSAEVEDFSGQALQRRDWFDLELTMKVDGKVMAFGQIFKAIAAGQRKILFNDGTYVRVDTPQFEALRQLIEEAQSMQERSDAPLQVSRYQLGYWDELTGLATVKEQSKRFAEAVQAWKQLRALAGSTSSASVSGAGATHGSAEQTTAQAAEQAAKVPTQIQASLRDYQVAGFSWLSFLYQHRLGAVLADDMGLGKTVQTLALIQHAKNQHQGQQAQHPMKPVLVVAPTSVAYNWVSEAQKFAPELKVVHMQQTSKKSGKDLADLLQGGDVLVTSYALFRIEQAEFEKHQFQILVLDEAQFAKNRKSKAHVAARAVDAEFKLAITGTPMENNVMELWSIFAIVAPGLFQNAVRFKDYYQKPIERQGDDKRLAQLRRRIKPLMLRRTKEQVITELPPKQEQVLEIELNPAHMKAYQTQLARERAKVMNLVENINKNRFTIFQSLTTLRQMSLDTSLVDPELTGISSSKLDALLEQLDDVLAEGHKALIFSQFTGFLGKLRARLEQQQIGYSYLDGSTRDRNGAISSFREDPDKQLFLISLKAGGFGLNLTEADYVFILDPWWNPAVEAQAVDRVHRIGQRKQVMVYRLVSRGTIEDKVMALKAKKSALFDSVLDDALADSQISVEDVLELFN